jgi:hypothetical protein
MFSAKQMSDASECRGFTNSALDGSLIVWKKRLRKGGKI